MLSSFLQLGSVGAINYANNVTEMPAFTISGSEPRTGGNQINVYALPFDNGQGIKNYYLQLGTLFFDLDSNGTISNVRANGKTWLTDNGLLGMARIGGTYYARFTGGR